MFTIRHFVVASVAGASLAFGVIGCQPERADAIPSTAQLQSSGNGLIHYTAPADGTTFIYDKAANKLLWSGKMTGGQSLDVDPTKNQILLNNMLVANQILSAGEMIDIYFEAAPVPPAPAPVTPAPQPPMQQSMQPSGQNYSNGLTVTPSVNVQQNSGGNAVPGSVTVQPGLSVTPTTQPSQP